MIAGCYSLDLYCEDAEGGPCPVPWNKFPDTFTGETWGQCVRQARRAGWRITRDRRAYCPECSGKKDRPRW